MVRMCSLGIQKSEYRLVRALFSLQPRVATVAIYVQDATNVLQVPMPVSESAVWRRGRLTWTYRSEENMAGRHMFYLAGHRHMVIRFNHLENVQWAVVCQNKRLQSSCNAHNHVTSK